MFTAVGRNLSKVNLPVILQCCTFNFLVENAFFVEIFGFLSMNSNVYFPEVNIFFKRQMMTRLKSNHNYNQINSAGQKVSNEFWDYFKLINDRVLNAITANVNGWAISQVFTCWFCVCSWWARAIVESTCQRVTRRCFDF